MSPLTERTIRSKAIIERNISLERTYDRLSVYTVIDRADESESEEGDRKRLNAYVPFAVYCRN